MFREVASGAKTDRAQLRRVLDELGAGDVLVVTRLDRLARSTRDLLNTLATITGRKARFRSLGDTWAHIIRVKKLMPAQVEVRYPVCVDGKRACPPEDCGGVWGYEEFLKAVRNPKHPEHEEMLEWAGGSFDPEHFSLEEANRNMRRMLRLAK